MKIKIRDYEWKIIEVDENEKSFFEEEELKYYGTTTPKEQIIRIYKKLTPIRKRQTLIHELTHAFMDTYLASQHIKDEFDEEDIACFMATYSEEIIRITDKYFKNGGKSNE